MPQRSSWLAVQTLINQRLTNLAILAEVRRQTPQISLLAGLGRFFSLSFFGVRMKLKVLIHNEGQLGKLQAVHNQLRHQVLGPLG